MVKCADCGYLGKVTGVAHEYFVEASGKERVAGVSAHHEQLSVPGYATGTVVAATIACYRNAFLLDKETQSSAQSNLPIITKDRVCSSFYARIPFWTAEHHLHEQRVEQLEQDRRRWEASQEELRKDWQEDLETARRRSEGTWNRRFVGVGIVGLVFAGAQVMAAIIGSAVGRGWEPGWWWF